MNLIPASPPHSSRAYTMGSLTVSKQHTRRLDAKFVKQSEFAQFQDIPQNYPALDHAVKSSSFSNASSMNAHEPGISRASWASQRLFGTASERPSIGEEVTPPQLSNAPYGWASSSIGFKLLQKSGWKEGTGLGVAEQGRLEPLEALVKYGKRGIGAKKDAKQKIDVILRQTSKSHGIHDSHHEKSLSRRVKKALANEKRIQEQMLQRDFFKEFWPENV